VNTSVAKQIYSLKGDGKVFGGDKPFAVSFTPITTQQFFHDKKKKVGFDALYDIMYYDLMLFSIVHPVPKCKTNKHIFFSVSLWH
jgi:hypothetical protein